MSAPSGMTLVEVLMALAVFVVLASAAAALHLSAVTLQGRAAALRATTEALEEASLPAAWRRAGWDPCARWRADGLPGACRAEHAPCCDHPAMRGASVHVRDEEGGDAVLLRVWARSAP